MAKPKRNKDTNPSTSINRGGDSAPETSAEQVREGQESQEAREAQASTRERMVDIGRGNQQAGRQGS